MCISYSGQFDIYYFIKYISAREMSEENKGQSKKQESNPWVDRELKISETKGVKHEEIKKKVQ